MKHKIIISMILSIVLLGSCANHQPSEAVVFSQIDSLFTSLYPVDEPGAAVLVVKNDFNCL